MQMKNALLHVEHERRYLHNKLQELKGNIRVYCRIRPPSPGVHPQQLAEIEYPADDNDVDESLCQAISISKELPSSEYLQGQTQARNKTSYTFKFDKVFGPSHQNSQVFDELSQLVQSALDGFNVCVFAYGQTGSGKTWTMSHPGDGMIPLTIHKIFDDISDLKQNGWEYSVEGQFLEIYNETIIDLLANGSGDTKYDIKHDDINGKTTISNLRTIRLNSAQEALMLFNKSALNRSTASTNSNERSSRSHSIFVLNIKGFNAKIGTSCEGCLNLVDLAGSERLNNSQAKGDRLKETQYINKSLSCLGDVIYSLGQPKNNHVPYRNSKLTYLLKHSLGGNSKTLMFVNISPAATNFNESLNSFRFATKVGNTKRGSGIRK
ncbi:kinesin-domain-containing protein [Yamadazyma tenuis ATCC 10573]|uniref:Kinesin-domain-containing protein n=2 Tax=Candida tenuis TaxID=2315449 RepID=G3BC10_CANTC|nr:kinesin-domain-containing protein [Yamadazyma tenuis ATCC 10573]EGV60753.1 kinesin-domain-containing protein [Yamadazyma tenuis ATCC 10573]